ncbi:TadE family protein [Rhizobium sp. RU33A]|uniref:TadE/TadG family type IV pilus assembly protein n=1 Tax=Rhizobium sp. RU33A TaxID=1907413 RepID=UPI00158F08C8|nr:TadE family protein [Rhizobium sp. RU33A]
MAIEFSILAIPFFAMIFAIIEVGYHALIQSELDRATTTIAQHISSFAHAEPTSSDYLAKGPCKDYVGSVLDCTKLRLGATEVEGRMVDFRNMIIGSSVWSLGCAGDTVIIELTYPYTELVSPIVIADVVNDNGGEYYRSRAVIRREPMFAGGSEC